MSKSNLLELKKIHGEFKTKINQIVNRLKEIRKKISDRKDSEEINKLRKKLKP